MANYAFWNCGVENIKIPASVTEIEEAAFCECKTLENISVDSKNKIYKSEGNCVIKKADNHVVLCLKNSVIPDYVTYIDKDTVNAAGIEDLIIPRGMKVIENYCFDGCRDLKSVVIPDGITSIGDYAFFYCTGLRNVTIPESVTDMGWAFGECRDMIIKVYGHKNKPEGWDAGWKAQSKNVFVKWDYKEGQEEETAVSESELKFALINDGTAYETVKVSKELTGNVTIPAMYDGKPVLRIGHGTFKNCPFITSIIIPAGITEISSRAFEFNAASKLKSIVIPDTVTTIGLYAFRGCTDLEKLELPDSVINFGINLSNEGGHHRTDGGEMFMNCASLKSVKLPKHLTKLGEKIFSQCHSLVSVIMPDNVEEIGPMAFMHCKELVDIKIPDNAVIGERAFYGCKKLKKK
jgi:hypothetical protein